MSTRGDWVSDLSLTTSGTWPPRGFAPAAGKAYIYKQAGTLIVPDTFRPATFRVLELPEMRFKIFRALDGERIFGTSPDRPCIRALRRPGG